MATIHYQQVVPSGTVSWTIALPWIEEAQEILEAWSQGTPQRKA